MDIVVHTSLWEGLARVLPQALIAGKPVVSYDVDGAKEVVIPGETGFLAPPESIEPLVKALCELARQRGAARKIRPDRPRAVHRPIPPRNDDPADPRGVRRGLEPVLVGVPPLGGSYDKNRVITFDVIRETASSTNRHGT